MSVVACTVVSIPEDELPFVEELSLQSMIRAYRFLIALSPRLSRLRCDLLRAEAFAHRRQRLVGADQGSASGKLIHVDPVGGREADHPGNMVRDQGDHPKGRDRRDDV